MGKLLFSKPLILVRNVVLVKLNRPQPLDAITSDADDLYSCILAKVSQVSVQTFEDWALEHIANGVCHQAIVEGPLTEWCEHNNVHLRSSFDHRHVKGTK